MTKAKFFLSIKFYCLNLGVSLLMLNVNTAFAEPAAALSSPADQPTVLSANAATNAAAVQPSREKLWNLDNADIRTVINEVAKETGKNFVIDPRVQGKVSLISGSPIKSDELYAIFVKILQAQGYQAVKSGNIVRIVPENTAKSLEIPTFNHLISDNVLEAFKHRYHKDNIKNNKNNPQAISQPGYTGYTGYVTQIIPVQYTQVNQLIPILRPLLPSAGEISAYSATNSIIISAEANKVSEIQKIIQGLDQPSAANIEVVSLHYANAVELVSSLRSILSGGSANTSGRSDIGIAADKNSNSILLSGHQAQRERIKQLIMKMDRLASSSAISSTTAVVHLRYLNAKEFAGVLQKMVSGGNSLDSNSAAGSGANNINNNNNALMAGVSGTPWGVSLSSYGRSEGALQIQAENETNAIVMSGPPSQIRALREVIAKLDIKPQQVLIQALIVEVSEGTVKQLGVDWGTLPPSGRTIATPTDFTSLTGGLGVGIFEAGRMKKIIHALQNDNTTNILSTPSIVVLDNQKAEIKVGKKVYDTTGSYTTSASSTSGSPTPFQTFGAKDVALHLNVTPQISQDNMIRMAIDQGNQTLLATTSAGGNQDTSESTIKTSVIIQSGQILVIGGLISNDYEDNVQKVPFLGNIPVLGKLFQYKNDNLAKKNLLVFLSPVIMDDKKTANRETSVKYNMIRELELARQKNQDVLTPDQANVLLPEFHAVKLPKPF